MLPDFEIITHRFEKNEDITVIPVGDVHLGAALVMEDEFQEFIEKVSRTPNTYLLLLGDLLDNGIKNSVSSVYKQKYMPSQAKRMMTEMLKPAKDRVLAAVMGNHCRRSLREVDDDMMLDICYNLGIEHLYRENVAFVKIQLGNHDKTCNSGAYNPTYMLVVTHGAGGGMLTGGTVNRAERYGYAIDGADAIILGHSHRPWTTQAGKIFIDARNNKVSIKPFKVISASSWLQYGGYAAAGMMLPTSYTKTKLILCGDHKEMKVSM